MLTKYIKNNSDTQIVIKIASNNRKNNNIMTLEISYGEVYTAHHRYPDKAQEQVSFSFRSEADGEKLFDSKSDPG